MVSNGSRASSSSDTVLFCRASSAPFPKCGFHRGRHLFYFSDDPVRHFHVQFGKQSLDPFPNGKLSEPHGLFVARNFRDDRRTYAVKEILGIATMLKHQAGRAEKPFIRAKFSYGLPDNP